MTAISLLRPFASLAPGYCIHSRNFDHRLLPDPFRVTSKSKRPENRSRATLTTILTSRPRKSTLEHTWHWRQYDGYLLAFLSTLEPISLGQTTGRLCRTQSPHPPVWAVGRENPLLRRPAIFSCVRTSTCLLSQLNDTTL